MSANGKEEMGDDGLPKITQNEADDNESKSTKMIGIMSVMAPAIGLGIAYGIYKFGNTAVYDTGLKEIVSRPGGGHWAHLSAFAFSRVVSFANFYPMLMKSRVMRGKSGNLRANMYIYKAVGKLGEGKPGSVVLNEDGDVGKYNRANRSLHHLVENMATFCVGIALASQAFPFPTFVLTLLFGLGRILHQTGYSSGGYGQHGKGFLLSTIATNAVDGLLLLTGLKGLELL